MSATSDNISPQRSPVTPHSSNRRTEIHSTRSLSQAIDALRRECEAVLWEFNSLKTQNSALQQRILDQAGELDTINSSLRALLEQHALIEHQYRDKLIALRSELRGLQDEQSSSTAASTSARQSRHSPSPPDWPHFVLEQRIPAQRPRPQSLVVATSSAHVPVVPLGLRAQTRNLDRNRGTDVVQNSSRHRAYNAITPQPPYTTLPLPHVTSHSSNQSTYPSQSQSRRDSSGYSRIHHSPRPPPLNPTSPSQGHDPSLSPTATLVGSDAPSRPRSRKG